MVYNNPQYKNKFVGKEINTQFLVKLRLGVLCIGQEPRRPPHHAGPYTGQPSVCDVASAAVNQG